jgi:outer membrane protein OmpA-like peptidoglycan-associated protein
MDEVTVYFANGKVALDPKYKPQLLELAEKAKTITAYTIRVKGYASSTGSSTLNQETKRGPGQQRHSISAARPRPSHEYAGARGYGRKQAGRK